jgi:hypothetical protein
VKLEVVAGGNPKKEEGHDHGTRGGQDHQKGQGKQRPLGGIGVDDGDGLGCFGFCQVSFQVSALRSGETRRGGARWRGTRGYRRTPVPEIPSACTVYSETQVQIFLEEAGGSR